MCSRLIDHVMASVPQNKGMEIDLEHLFLGGGGVLCDNLHQLEDLANFMYFYRGDSDNDTEKGFKILLH